MAKPQGGSVHFLEVTLLNKGLNIGERPRSTSAASNNTLEYSNESSETTSIEVEDNFSTVYESRDIYKDQNENKPETNEVDTSIVIVNQKGEERKFY